MNSLEIIVSRRDGGNLLHSKSLNKIARFQDFPEMQPEIIKSFSIGDSLSYLLQGKKINRPRKISNSDVQLRLLKQILSHSPLLTTQARPWIDKSFAHLHISARMGAIGSKAASRLYGRIERYIQKKFGDILQARLTGKLLLLSNMSNNLVSRQIKSLVFATLFVLLLIGLLFRSMKIVLLSAIPNIIPICVVFGLIGWMKIPLSVPTAIISSISLGLVVDNTIQFLYSFQKLRQRGNHWNKAIGLTLQTTGKPISISAVVLIGGFWVGIIGSFLPAVYFSIFMGLTILIAVLCDLIYCLPFFI